MAGGSGSAQSLPEKTTHPFDAGTAFVLAAGGLRRLRGYEEFLGYSATEMFWKDVLDLVHEEDLARAGRLVSGAVGKPDVVLNAGLRMRDAAGGWRLIKATVRNIVEVPGDAGLVLAELREVGQTNGHGGPLHP
jgi:hypothetical protein